MHYEVIISLASNFGHEQNLCRARLCLERLLSDCRYSPTIWTVPIASPSTPKYLNQLLLARTTFTAAALQQFLKAVERHLGRCDTDRRQGMVRVDLDLLRHDGCRYHLDDWNRPYVQTLIKELGL